MVEGIFDKVNLMSQQQREGNCCVLAHIIFSGIDSVLKPLKIYVQITKIYFKEKWHLFL